MFSKRQNLLSCILCGYILGCLYTLLVSGVDPISKYYVSNFSLLQSVIPSVAFSAVLCLIAVFKKVDFNLLLTGLIFAYSLISIWKMTNTTAYFGFACIAVLAMIIFRFADIKETEILKCRKAEIILFDNRRSDYQEKLEKYRKMFSVCEVHGVVTAVY